jgi:cell division septal protein FtsQ
MGKRVRRRRVRGFLPRLGRGLAALGRWLIRHPQATLVLLLLTGMAWSVWSYVHHAASFRIVRVELPPQSSLQLPDRLIGVNLWQLDIHALAEDLKRQQPWLKDVRVIRQLPNSLRIEVIERRPIAQVQLDRWYPVDGEGFVLPRGQAQASPEVVRLVGAQSSNAPLKAGRLTSSEPLQLALRVLQTVQRSRALTARRLQAIDVSNPQQISFVIDGGTEIRCGSEAELDAHLRRLRTALQMIAKQRLEARYIDVRFQEPIVSPRT